MVSIRPDWPKRQFKALKASEAIAREGFALDLEEVERELNRPSNREKGVYVNRLRIMSVNVGLIGTIQLLSGAIEPGWHDTSRSLQMALAAFKIRAAMGFPNYSGLDTTRACLLLCTAIALQSEAVAKWLAELIVSSHQNQGPLKGWTDSPFEPLTLRHAYSVQGTSPMQLPRAKKLAELYDELVAAEDVEATQAAISRIALNRVQLVSEGYVDFPPFQNSPFDLFPVELLAHLMVRYSSVPKFDFGPLESPLSDPPLPFPHQNDPLVERVMARAQTLLPIADVQWE